MAKRMRTTVYWTCAVCHKVVKESQAVVVQHEDQIYYTCSVRCSERFTMFPSEDANTTADDEIDSTPEMGFYG